MNRTPRTRPRGRAESAAPGSRVSTSSSGARNNCRPGPHRAPQRKLHIRHRVKLIKRIEGGLPDLRGISYESVESPPQLGN